METREPGWKKPSRNRDAGKVMVVDDWSPRPKIAAASMPSSTRLCAVAGAASATTAESAATYDEMVRMKCLPAVDVSPERRQVRRRVLGRANGREGAQNRCA